MADNESLHSTRRRGMAPPWHWKPINGRVVRTRAVDIRKKWDFARRMASNNRPGSYHIVFRGTIEAAKYLNGIEEK